MLESEDDKWKVSSEETLSCEDANLLTKHAEELPEQNTTTHMGQCETETKKQPNLFRQVAHVCVFNVYNAIDGLKTEFQLPKPIHPQRGFYQASRLEANIFKFLEEGLIPNHCSHGCYVYDVSTKLKSSILGPEFLDFTEPSSFPSHELAAIATDISSIAWQKGGVANNNIVNVSVVSAGSKP
ncbi:transcription factor MYB1-like [Impatiens glandulifera]|uniref:transcription factor MYB1-like n=1 Tax=Impatiens glandulifera TaxID=253017 RepID=UPI001FB04BF4|nr:transcription factor MYB1-like [Impatiens glandulifera]